MKRGDITLAKKVKFIESNRTEANDAFCCEDSIRDCFVCKAFTEKARKTLGYSKKTNDIDILSGLRCAWKKSRP